MITNTEPEFFRILADESHQIDRHCACGRIMLDPWAIECEHCQAIHIEQPLVNVGGVVLTTPELARELTEAAA